MYSLLFENGVEIENETVLYTNFPMTYSLAVWKVTPVRKQTCMVNFSTEAEPIPLIETNQNGKRVE